MLKVELESAGRLHSILMKALRRKNSENHSLFKWDSDWTGYEWSHWDMILGVGR